MKKIKMNWMTKLVIPLLCLGMIGVTILTVVNYREVSSRSGNIAMKQLYDTTQTIQLTLEKDLQSYIHSLKTLKSMIENKPYINKHDKEVILNGLEMLLEEYPELFGAWAIIEPEFVQNAHRYKNSALHDRDGRYAPYLDDMKGMITYQTLVSHLREGEDKSFYTIPLETHKIYVTPAISYLYKGESVKVISICMPFEVGGEMSAILGVDLELSSLTEYISSYKIYENGYAVLFDRDRTILAHPDERFLDTNPYEENKMIPLEKATMDHTMQAHEFMITQARAGGDGELAYKTFVPVFIDPAIEPYIVQIVVPVREILAPVKRFRLSMLALGIGTIIFMSFITQRFIVYNIRKIDDEVSWLQYLSNK